MLSDAQIERYGRQILLPEVGGRGQERLLAARVAVAGAGPAAVAAVTLLGRAGVGRLHVSARVGPLPELSPDCRLHRDPTSIEGPLADVAISLLDLASVADDTPAHGVPFGLEQASRPFVLGLLGGDRLLVATLVGRPCMRCWGQALGPDELGGRAASSALDPARLQKFHLPIVQVFNSLQAKLANTGGGFYMQGCDRQAQIAKAIERW